MLSYDRLSQKLAIGLAALAGFVDALGFLSLGGVFVSFMSGNSTRFAVELGGGAALKIALLPLGVIVLFVSGVMLGRIIRHLRPRNPSTSVLVFMTAMLGCAGGLQEFYAAVFAIPFMAIAMGAANNVFVQNGEVSIGVTYMTGTLVKFGQHLAGRLIGEGKNRWLPYFLLWIGLICGALLGAAGYGLWGLRTLWAGVAACLIFTLIYARIERSHRSL